MKKMNNDTISREAAIAAADRADYPGLAIEDVKAVTDEVVKELKKLPSAKQYGRWTPITDGLPEIGDRTLVTIPSIDETFITIGTYAGEYRWHISDYGFCEKIIAWMPLPHPYKVGEQNE